MTQSTNNSKTILSAQRAVAFLLALLFLLSLAACGTDSESAIDEQLVNSIEEVSQKQPDDKNAADATTEAYVLNFPFTKEATLTFVNAMIEHSDFPMEMQWIDDDIRYDETGYVVKDDNDYGETGYYVILDAKLPDYGKETVTLCFVENTYNLSHEVCRIEIRSHEGKNKGTYIPAIAAVIEEMLLGESMVDEVFPPFDEKCEYGFEKYSCNCYNYVTWAGYDIYDSSLLSD